MASNSKQIDEILSNWCPELHRSCKKLVENITEKDEKKSKIQNEVYFLTTEVNELERFSSKDSNIILNLPLFSGNILVGDVIKLMQKDLQFQVNQSGLIACHFLNPYNSTADPPPVLVKFVHFWRKMLFRRANIGWKVIRTKLTVSLCISGNV